MLRTLTVFGLWLATCNGFSTSVQEAPGHHINNVRREYTSAAPSDLENAMNSTMILSFSTESLYFEIDLTLNREIYGKHTKIYGLDSNGEPKLQPRKYRAFTGQGKISNTNDNNNNNNNVAIAGCSVIFYKDLRFHAQCTTKDEIYSIDWKELHTRHYGNDAIINGKDTNTGMVLEIGSEIKTDDIKSHSKRLKNRNKLRSSLLKTKNERKQNFFGNHKYNNNYHNKRSLLNDQSYLEPFTDCFDSQYQYIHQLYVGHVTDESYEEVYNNDQDSIETGVLAIFNDATESNSADVGSNTIYYYQLNVKVTLGTLYTFGSYSGTFTYDPWSLSSSLDINTRLNYFNTWREEYYNQNTDDTNGLWHLMTNNHPAPGTVGIAWIGVICSYAYGTGVTNHYYSSTWEIWAHEVGHNFGGNHAFDEGTGTTGGIMDYGDGLYPVSYGAYQFHPTYNKDEVCEQITESYAESRWYKKIPLANCWHEYTGDSPTNSPSDRPTDRPTPVPTSRPTNRPTDQPIIEPTRSPQSDPTKSPIPAPTKSPSKNPSSSPTDRPTPAPTTAKPTKAPNDAPTASPTDGYTYEWVWDGVTYSDCDLTCVDSGETSYKNKIYYCYRVTTTSGGSTVYTWVDDSKCDASSKPEETVECSSSEVPECDSTCGDGIVSSDEICDTNGDNGDCCKDDCSGYKTDTIDCWMVNPIIDAAFLDDDLHLYLFQGKYYARYSTYYWGWTENTPDDGYPKLIENSFPITSFTEDITAIAYASDSEVYVFQGMEYVKIDMLSGEYSGYPRTFTDDFNVPDDIETCGSITGAYAVSGCGVYIRVFCDTIYGWAHKRWHFNWVYSITQWGDDYEDQKITASFNYPGYYYYFWVFTTDGDEDSENTNSRRRRRMIDGNRRRLGDATVSFASAQSIFSGSNVTSLEDADSNSCADENCASCNSDDINICYECYDNYLLYGSVKCLSNNTLLYLDFDIYSPLSVDHYFVEGGRSTLEEYTYVNDGVTGQNATAIYFDGTTKLVLEPLDYDNENQYVESFKISFRFRPDSVNYDKFMSIDNDLVSIYLIDNTEESSIVNGSAEYTAIFKVGNNTYKSSMSVGLDLNEWNTLELQYANDQFKVYVNGDVNSQAYTDFSGIFVELRFNEWYIGDSSNGVTGALDQVSFKVITSSYDETTNLNSGSTIINEIDDSKYKTWLVIGIVFIILSLLFGIGFCCMSYMWYKGRNSAQPESHDMNYFQMK